MNNGLIIDNFAGGGGASTGIEMALGRAVDIAVNHDSVAISMHEANHPATTHYCESVWDIDPRKVCAGRPVGLAWFSPDCTHFSKAKGSKPVKKEIRGLAWVVIRWASTVRPQVIMLENVEEFVTWGPLVKNEDGNFYPCPQRKGKTFNIFINALIKKGYNVEYRTLRACDYGAPTIRKRLFLIARCDGQPIVWPQPTHGDPKSEAVKAGRLKPWRTAAECIDWSIPCPSIFERKRPLAEATMRRIAKGIMRYVINAAEPFIVKNNFGSTPHQSLHMPLHTITTQGNKHALVTPVLCNTANSKTTGRGPNCWDTREPLRTVTSAPGICKPLGTVVAQGEKHALVTAFLAQHNTGATGHDMREPVSTITQEGSQQQLVTANLVRHMGQSVGSNPDEPMRSVVSKAKDSLVTSHMVKLRGTNIGSPVTEPVHTVTAGGTHLGEVRAFLLKYYGNEADGVELKEPMHTVTTKDRFGLVTVAGEDYQIVDIGMRMLTPRELFRAQGFPDSYIIDRGADGKPLTKTSQVAKCGNSVCPPIAEALVRANVVEAEMPKRRSAEA